MKNVFCVHYYQNMENGSIGLSEYYERCKLLFEIRNGYFLKMLYISHCNY